MKCREKQLPHYFGRLIHALDLIKFSQNEGTLKNLHQQQVSMTNPGTQNYLLNFCHNGSSFEVEHADAQDTRKF